MFFFKGQCDFSACKDLVCLLSNLVEHVLIAYGTLGSFSSFVILLYFAELSTTKCRVNLLVLSEDFWCLGLHCEWEPAHHMIECELEWKVKPWVRSRNMIGGRGMTTCIHHHDTANTQYTDYTTGRTLCTDQVHEGHRGMGIQWHQGILFVCTPFI